MKLKLTHLIGALCVTYIHNTIACTSFGYITKNGTVIAKNSDYYYDEQYVDILMPNKQFIMWYDNPYGNNLKIVAQMANNNIKMGINEVGLTAVEEDPLMPKDRNHRRFIQPINGNSECMTLWGILQNFKTIDQLMPYITVIFSHAAPNYYQIADSHKILTVEVAYADYDNETTRKFSYKIISKVGENYSHTNNYQNPKFIALNQLSANSYATLGSEARNAKIKTHLTIKDEQNENNVLSWLLDTKSDIKNPKNKTWCQNTSIFRSNLNGKLQIDTTKFNSGIYGTVSSMTVFNHGTAMNTRVVIKLIDKIIVTPNGNQTITYRELDSNLATLLNHDFNFIEKSLTRNAPINGECK